MLYGDIVHEGSRELGLSAHRRALHVWLLAFVAFFLVCGAWAVAAPYNATPDEFMHVIRAAGVAQGQVFQRPAEISDREPGAYQTVPRGLVPLRTSDINPWFDRCYYRVLYRSAACAPQPGPGGSTPRTVFTSAGRYNPLYYAVVGEPLVRSPNWTGILLARLISAGLCAAFLASAWLSCVQWRRSALMTGALMIAATPMALQLAGGVNPNAVEIAAGISLAAAVIPLLLDDDDSPYTRGWLRRAAIAAIAIGQLRALGPVFVVGWLVILLLPPVRARLRQLRSRPSTWFWSAGVLVSCVLGVAWTVAFKSLALGLYAQQQYTRTQIFGHLVTVGMPTYLEKMVDGFGGFPTVPAREIFMVWAMAFGALLLAAFAWGSWIERWRLGALTTGTLLVPTISDLATVNKYGYAFQGRYLLPVAAGIPLLAAYVIGRSGAIPVAPQAAVTRILTLLLLPMHLFSLAYVMDRWQSGLGAHHSLNPLHGRWHPVTGSGLPLLLMVLGLIMLGGLAWHATKIRAEHPTVDQLEPQVVADLGHAGPVGGQAAIPSRVSLDDGATASGSRLGQMM